MNESKSTRTEAVTLVVTTPEAFQEVVDNFGILITPYVAASMAGVSEQRVFALIEQGRFTKIVIYGTIHISQEQFEMWRTSPRKPGRPRKGVANT